MVTHIARGPIRWWLKLTGFAGITLPPFGVFITAERMSDVLLHKHEQAHWQQYQRMGLVKFYVLYLYYLARYGYWNSPLEVEAREAEYK